MTPERWQRVEQLLHSALKLEENNRADFLKQACDGHEALRSEVESLLACESEAKSFLQAPALEMAAKAMAEEPDRVLVGRQIGAYKITSLLGAGGMGEVYRAEDTRLGRAVAVKVLPEELAQDKDRLRRFEREARAASALNHANVAHIYEIGQSDRLHFIAMEYVEGQSLAQKISGQPLELKEVLEIGIQAADALEEAHRKGITHRDIKPANLMITAKGQVKVLDFGLAKITRPEGEAAGSDVSTSIQTAPGRILGTLQYMSPEQVLAKELDARTDLFSLGVVLYEMTTGRQPFSGKQASEVMDRILHAQPEALARFNYDVPAELERIIRKCLEKDRERRYQLAREVQADLSRLKEGSAPLPRPASASAGGPSRRNWPSWAVGLAAMVALSISVWRFPGWPDWKQGTVESQHLAVLPFKVLGGEVDLRVFADGLMETITSRLSQYEHGDSPLLVVPASEVRQQSAKSAGDAAKRFGVTAAVEGSVQSQGSRVRLLLTLIDTKQQRQTETIIVEDERANALSLQDAAVSRLANALSLHVQPQHTSDAIHFTAVAPGAYEFYVHARGYLQRTDKLDSVENAITVARRALEIDPKYAAAHAALGEAYWYKFELTRAQEWIEQALASCRRSLELNGNLQEAHVTMGKIHVGTGRFSEAQQNFEKALAVNGRSHEAYQGLADVYFRLNQFDKAEATYAKAISMRPGDWNGYRRMGFFYFRRGEFDKAAEQYEKVVALTPDNALGYVNLGTIHFRKERFEDAKKMWLKALELDPDRFTTIMNLAKLHHEMGEYKAAIQLYERAVKVNERDYLSWGNLGIAYKHENQPAKAATALATAIKLTESELLVNPKRADLYSFTAYYRAMAGTQENVDALARRALELGGDDNDIVVRIAGTYALMGRNDAAADLVKKAVARGYPAKSLLRHVPLRGVVTRLGIDETTGKK